VYHFQIDGAQAISAKLESMISQIGELKRNDFADEFALWQTQDMHREHAAVQRTRGGWKTTVRPHSRFEMLASRRYQRRQLRRVSTGTKRAAAAFMAWQAKHSTRPILRAELLDQLRERMIELVQSKLKW
jgi:hypothetical protein